jgi:tetratricopeptide (TPR) repeat protein
MTYRRAITFIVLAAVCGLPAAAQEVSDKKAPALRPLMVGASPAELRIWSAPAFREQFAESYIPVSDIEPQIKDSERKQMLEIVKLLRPDEEEEKLLTPDKEEAALIADEKYEEARAIRQEKLAEANRIRTEKTEKAAALLIKLQGANASAVVDFTLGNIYFQNDRLDEAQAEYLKAVEKAKKFRRAWQNLGLIYIRQEKFAEAIKPMTRVITLGGTSALNYGLLGYAYSRVENNLAAESAYRMAILMDPETMDWKMGLTRSLFLQQRYADVVALLDMLLAKMPDRADLWLLQANAYIGLERPMKAAENYQIVDRLGESTVESLNNMGDIYINDEVYDLAVQAYLDALAKGEKASVDRPLRAARVLAGRSAYGPLRTLIDGVETQRGSQLTTEQKKDLLKMKARLAVAGGSGDEEAMVLEQIVAIDPMDGEALILLGEHAQRGEDKEKAMFYYDRAAAIPKFEADALVRKAQLLVGTGKYEEALPLLRRAQTIKPRENVGKYLAQVERVAKGR